MSHESTVRIMSSIERQWNILESFLYYPTKILEFDSYLNNYRGLPSSSSNFTFKRNEQAENSALGVLNFFINIFALEGLAELEPTDIEIVLGEVEKNVNLALYYWFGLNDRNYQFRTWIHFFGLESLSNVFLTKDKHDYSVTLSDNGICFGLFSEPRMPQILPISKVFVDPAVSQLDDKTDRWIFARLRTIQREVCLLIDEWEYQNSILAVEYSQSLQSLQSNKFNNAEESHKIILKKMDLKRNFLANFCLESVCDFQEWVNIILVADPAVKPRGDMGDISSEIDALCALMLSALQKFFLPASISRLVYGSDVILLVQRFAKARLDYCPEDFSAQLILQATQSAQGHDIEPSLFHILKSKPFEWKLCFDPSAGLKAFSWAYSRKHHIILCTIMGICYFKKCYANHLDEYQFSDLVSAYQTQDSFLNYLKREVVPEPMVDPDFQDLFTLFTKYLETHIKQSKSNDEGLEIINNYLGLL